MENTGKTTDLPVHDAEGLLRSALKPLLFASKDAFRHLSAVKSIEPFMSSFVSKASCIFSTGAQAGLLASFKAQMDGFDASGIEARMVRLKNAVEIIERLIKSIDTLAPVEAHDSSVAVSVRPDDLATRIEALGTPVELIKGVGPKVGEMLRRKGISTVEDLLYFVPSRYEDRSSMKRIRELVVGESASVVGSVLVMGEARYGRRKVYEIVVGDGGQVLKLKWFNYKASYMKLRFRAGQRLLIYGAVSAYGAQKEIIHPEIETLDDSADTAATEGIVPVYSQIETLHPKTLRKIMKNCVDGFAGFAVGAVSEVVLKRHGLLPVGDAFREAHQPSAAGMAELARKSLAFDELYVLETGLAIKRQSVRKESGIEFKPDGRLESRLRELFPYALTGSQERVLAEIMADMTSSYPMNRLVQGDVGSGKTIVSLIAAIRAIESGYQAAIMAPTEILAEQHYLTIHSYAESLGIRVCLLTASLRPTARKNIIDSIRNGEVDLVVGTHALIQKDVEFKRLGLAVVDEQHRFGVVQRAALKKKGFGPSPDMLIMTATPIPRTLSMTVFGDLDVSMIDELPPGRKPVYTRVIRESERLKAYDAIRKELEDGHQCYIVYPLVDESEELSLKDATNMKEHLQKDVFIDSRLGLLHGRLSGAEKEQVMRDFKERRLDILVATTVLEVGVDVPNASVILIEHAERFGLAQLHQLRGRVGRGERRSTCLLLAQWTNSDDTLKRLKVMESTNDGFKIAEEDLLIRGPGDFLGTRQSGLPEFRSASLLTDLSLLKKARHEASSLLAKDPGLVQAGSIFLRHLLKARWAGRLELAEIG